ncbi:MAG: cobalt ECF transporter T component CbiQ [Patescibacteria group bacterium]|nr:cobalt ECF transporter T component CbiQ [Patescibacteria group bacterium]
MSFIEKNLENITGAIQNSVFSETIAKKDGLLQRLDPRTKIVCFILFLLAVNLSVNLYFIISVYIFLLIFAGISKISLKFFITRVWLFLPFFTGIIALPAIFNFFTPGKPLLTLINNPQQHLFIAVTQNGLLTALFLLTRVATSVSLGILLVLTTPWIRLLKALDRLHAPQILIIMTMMTYRYIFVLLETVNSMFLARKSRMVGRFTQWENRHLVSSALGTLFGKTQVLSEEIYQAMLSRGYRNKIYILSDFSLTILDFWSIVATTAIIFGLFLIWRTQ